MNSIYCYGIILVIFVSITIYNILRYIRRHPYLKHRLSNEEIFDPRLFHNHNHCRINYSNDFLTAYRYENRVLLYGSQGQFNQTLRACGVTTTAIGDFHSVIHNYIVLQRGIESQRFVLEIPSFEGLHPNLRWNSQFEDPRLFQDRLSNRLFVTATVLTFKSVRIAMIELDPISFTFKKGIVLGSDEELKEMAFFPQKNWVMFNGHDDQVYILTHASPNWIVFRIDLDTGALSNMTKVDSTSFFASEIKANLFLRCSSGMIRWSDHTLLTILHTRENKEAPIYRSLFVECADVPPFQPVRKSKVLQFKSEHYRVEFTAGLCEKDPSTLYISLGLDDVKGETVEYLKKNVFDN